MSRPGRPIYLDHSATAPLHPEVRKAMLPWMDTAFGNPGSLHRLGREAREAVEQARAQVARLLHADPRDITFTSTGTEANNLAIHGILATGGQGIIGGTEHHAVLGPARRLEARRTGSMLTVPPTSSGAISPEAVAQAITPGTRLVSLMMVNNETGVLADVAAVGVRCRDRGVLFHTDAVQACPYIDLDVSTLPVDLMAVSAHKINGPKGAGALYVRPGVRLDPLLSGGGQEHGLRAGTENVMAIAGFGQACELLFNEREARAAHVLALRVLLESGLKQAFPDCWINGEDAPRAPHIVNVGVKAMDGEMLLYALDAEGIAVSKGAACASGSPAPSHVLLAMGQDYPTAQAAIRLSLSWMNSMEEIERFLEIFAAIVRRLRT